jgi:hypothetical protein
MSKVKTGKATGALPKNWQSMAEETGKPFAEGGAYSSDCYADWTGCVTLLRERGASLDGARTLLRSKHMRWCSDEWRGKYGAASVAHFAHYLDGSAEARRMAGIDKTPSASAINAIGDALSVPVGDALALLRRRVERAILSAAGEERATANRERELHCGGQVSALKAVLTMIDEVAGKCAA